MLSVVLMTRLLACERNACVEMCQEYQRWIDECGSSWEAEFPSQNWHSVEDCYEAHWEATPGDQKQCDHENRSYSKRQCY